MADAPINFSMADNMSSEGDEARMIESVAEIG